MESKNQFKIFIVGMIIILLGVSFFLQKSNIIAYPLILIGIFLELFSIYHFIKSLYKK
jgi:hypothetical protein